MAKVFLLLIFFIKFHKVITLNLLKKKKTKLRPKPNLWTKSNTTNHQINP